MQKGLKPFYNTQEKNVLFEKVERGIKARSENRKEERREGVGGDLKLFNKVIEAYRILSVATVNFCGNHFKD